jgi:hypothetical protein
MLDAPAPLAPQQLEELALKVIEKPD